ncbi:MAG: hypothetical protein DHS20C01_05670 [marine bacterium B5-7]|nr:MAG: hypothetical protein DHS20C01_05670 [marine bacterium B5-7]
MRSFSNQILAILLTLLLLPSLTFAGSDGLVTVKSPHSVQETADKLVAVLNDKGMVVFNRIDHAAGAEKSGLTFPPTTQVIFGNPKIGTPLMNCQRTVAIDLPQKMLIWEDISGQVWLAYNDPAYIKARHGVTGCDEVFDKVAGALAKFASASTAP